MSVQKTRVRKSVAKTHKKEYHSPEERVEKLEVYTYL